MSSAIRWAPIPRCTSASMRRSAAFRSWRPVAAGARRADAKKREEMKALAAETGKMFAEEGIAAAAAKYADAPMRQAQKNKDPRGYAEFARMLARALRRRPRAHHAQSAAQAADAVGDGGGAEEILGAAAGHRRRRGRALHRRQRLSQAHRADGRPAGDSALRPQHHRRRSRPQFNAALAELFAAAEAGRWLAHKPATRTSGDTRWTSSSRARPRW